MFYLKEFLSHYKFTPLACFLVKYREHECNMGRPVPPPCCLWVVRLPCHHCRWAGPGPLSAPDPGGPLAPSCPVWPCAWWSRQAMCPGSSRVSLSFGWPRWGAGSSAVDVMCFEGHYFLIIYNTVWIHPDLESLVIVQVNGIHALHLNAFVLNLAPILLCYFGRYIFRVWFRPVVHWTLPYLGFSHCISAVPGTIKTQGLPASGTLMV